MADQPRPSAPPQWGGRPHRRREAWPGGGPPAERPRRHPHRAVGRWAGGRTAVAGVATAAGRGDHSVCTASLTAAAAVEAAALADRCAGCTPPAQDGGRELRGRRGRRGGAAPPPPALVAPAHPPGVRPPPTAQPAQPHPAHRRDADGGGAARSGAVTPRGSGGRPPGRPRRPGAAAPASRLQSTAASAAVATAPGAPAAIRAGDRSVALRHRRRRRRHGGGRHRRRGRGPTPTGGLAERGRRRDEGPRRWRHPLVWHAVDPPPNRRSAPGRDRPRTPAAEGLGDHSTDCCRPCVHAKVTRNRPTAGSGKSRTTEQEAAWEKEATSSHPRRYTRSGRGNTIAARRAHESLGRQARAGDAQECRHSHNVAKET